MIDSSSEIWKVIDRDVNARIKYETSVVSKSRILDVGGRNAQSMSRERITRLGRNPDSMVVCTDIIPDYSPDLVDDICSTSIAAHSFDGVYLNAVLEHVTEYWKAIDNVYNILAPVFDKLKQTQLAEL